MIFEISWEVCNKVGGINTVLRTKTPFMNYKEHYLIGPYIQEQEFQRIDTPKGFHDISKRLEEKGIILHFGKWLIQSKPNVILVEFKNYFYKLNELKTIYWEKFGVESLFARYDFEEPLIWSSAIGSLIEEYYYENKEEKIIVHAHEWMSGFANLYVKSKNLPIKTIFTTHATMLGRTLSGNNIELYSVQNSINPYEEAKRFNVLDKFSAEVACAKNSTYFTTVSKITAKEAKNLLGVKPIITENGMNTKLFPTIEETSIKHTKNKELIKDFCRYFFFPYYDFDLENTFFLYSASRYEFKNKGLDIFIRALKILNDRLKKEKSKINVVSFFFIPGDSGKIRNELLDSKNYYTDFRDYIELNEKEIISNIITSSVKGEECKIANTLPEDFELKQKLFTQKFSRKNKEPLICTHYMNNENADPILNELKVNNLLNYKEDKVKAVSYPIYLEGIDGLLDLTIEEVMSAMHLGIFPSYYEPWGYTPPESMLMGVPALTTDLSGFGRFMKEKINLENSGLFVIERENKTQEEVTRNLANKIYEFITLNKHDRVLNKINAKKYVELVDWSNLIKKYKKLYDE